MSQCQEFKDAMQELIDANRARVEAYGDREATNIAIARMEVAERKALELMDTEAA